MMRLLILTLLLAPLVSISQDGRFGLGARNAGLAGASVTLGDQYSLFNNVGGLGRVENHHVLAGYQNRYGISEFQVVGAGALYATRYATAGVGFYKFGDDLFSQQRIHLAIGNQFQIVSLGLGIDLLQYNVSTVGTRQVVAIQFGGIGQITEQLFFGAHIFNLNQADLVKETGEKVPTVMKGGLSYRPSEELMINVEVEKDLDFDETIKAGVEYEIIESVFLRTGISTEPVMSAFGAGFHPKKFRFDYAYSNDSKLGAIHEISISYSFER